VPMIPATLSSRTLDQLMPLVAGGRNGGPRIFAFLSMLDLNRPLHRELLGRLRATHPTAMLGAAIPVADEVERMGEERDVVGSFAPASPAAAAYEALWLDVRFRLSNSLRRP
jgi:chromosome partitioning protein